MKNICGIELKGNDAIMVVLKGDNTIPVNKNKITLSDSKNQDSIRKFCKEISEFFESNHIDLVGIKERATKGRFAGGAVSFKMEGLIQKNDCSVILVHSKTINAKLKGVDLNPYNVLKYQEGALQVAIFLSLKLNE